jgi:uncharacterized membrane protein
MTIGGKKIAISVLVTYILGLGLVALGLVQNIVTGWKQSDPQGDYLLLAGALTTLINTGVHNWPGTAVAPPPPPPPAPVA